MKKLFSLLIAASFLCVNAMAVDPNHFTINRISAPYFIVDGNSPATVTRCYVGFEVINNSNSGVTYDRLVFSIPSVTSSVAATSYDILAPSNRTVNVGTLAPGQSKVCYFFVVYPANVNATASFTTVLSDESPVVKTTVFSIRNRSSISANAGGSSTNAFSNQDLLGGILTDTVTYAVGNARNGDENDFQVAATPSFDPTKLELIQTRVIQSSVPGIRVGTTDSLYFISGNGSTGSTVRIVWTFRIVAFNFTTNLLPLAGATNGSNTYKYSLNSSLGTGTPITISANANKLSISKSSDADVYCAGNSPLATFTITISNAGAYDVSIQKITDTLPAGFSLAGLDPVSDVSLFNSVAIPEAGATGEIIFEGGVSAGSSTSYVIPAGGSINLIYYAAVPAGNAANLITTASAYVGTTRIGSASNSVSVSCLLPVTISQFTALRQNNNVMLRWTTEREFNSREFIIQHSTDGSRWSDIGSVSASGQSETRRTYSQLHRQPARGVNYYRLKEVSTTGAFSLSQIARILFDESGLPVRVYPNPVTGGIMNVETDETEKILLVNSKGQTVLSQKTTAGTNRLNVSSLSRGLYLLRTEKETIKIIID